MVDHSVVGRSLARLPHMSNPGGCGSSGETLGERNPAYTDAGAAKAAGYAAIPVPPTYLFV